MTPTTERPHNRPRTTSYTKALYIVLVLLASGYLAQIYSPLRLNTDVITYLSVAISAADGQGFVHNNKPTYYPIGYPAIIASLDRAGLGLPSAFVALNLFFLILGFGATYYVLHQGIGMKHTLALLLIALTLLSYVFVKQVTLAMADIPFFGVALLCLSVLTRAEQYSTIQRWYYLLLALILAIAATFLRTVGIALIPALLWAIFSTNSPLLSPLQRLWKNHIARWLLIGGGVGAALLGNFLISHYKPGYYNELLRFYRQRDLAEIIEIILDRLHVWGELLVNLPASKLPFSSAAVLSFMGVLSLSLIGIGLWKMRRRLRAVTIFFLAYAAIMFIWPAFGVRFWLPVVPLIMAYVATALERLSNFKPLRPIIVLYLIWFLLTGSAALAYSSYISFSGSAFPSRYAGGTYSPIYDRALGKGSEREIEEAGLGDIDGAALRILQRYEPTGSSHLQPKTTSSP